MFLAIAASSINGIAQRPTIVALQEQDNTSTTNLATLLNTLYGAGSSYVAVQPGGQVPSDRLAYVYDSTRVNQLGPVAVIESNGTRDHLRAQFRPVGYISPAAVFYVYTSHLNAGSTSIRATEAAALRANSNALPAGSHFIATGDYNIDSSSEPAYQNLTVVGGPGRAGCSTRSTSPEPGMRTLIFGRSTLRALAKCRSAAAQAAGWTTASTSNW